MQRRAYAYVDCVEHADWANDMWLEVESRNLVQWHWKRIHKLWYCERFPTYFEISANHWLSQSTCCSPTNFVSDVVDVTTPYNNDLYNRLNVLWSREHSLNFQSLIFCITFEESYPTTLQVQIRISKKKKNCDQSSLIKWLCSLSSDWTNTRRFWLLKWKISSLIEFWKDDVY